MKINTHIDVFASKDMPVKQEILDLVIDLVHQAKENELSQTYFARANVEKLTRTTLNLKITEYPSCYDVILGPCPTVKFIVPPSETFSTFLTALSNLTSEEN